MDWISNHIFPEPKPIGHKVFGHQITQTDLALAAYTLILGAVLAFYFGWIYFVATILSMIFAGMLMTWFF
jgi:hypothetical protein